MRICYVLGMVALVAGLGLAVPLTPEQVTQYTTQLAGADAKAASEAARRLAADKQVGLLLQALTTDEPARRTTVLYALQYCLEARAVAALLDVLKQDPEPRVRGVALAVLGAGYARPELKAQQPALRQAFLAATRDTDQFVARDAVTALLRAAPDDAPVLLAIVTSDRPASARGQAALALAEAPGEAVYEALVRAAREPGTEVASLAATALGRRGDRRAAPLLLELLQDRTRHPQIAANAAQALALLAAPEVLESLLTLAQTPGLRRDDAMMVLSGYDDPRVGALMIPALADRSASVRRAAAMAIAKLKYAPATDALLAQAAAERDAGVRASVLEALVQLAETRARELFAAATTDSDGFVRLAGIRGLLALRDDRGLEPAVAMLHGTSHETDTAIGLLGGSGSARAIEPLLQYFQERAERKRQGGWGATEQEAVQRLVGGDVVPVLCTPALSPGPLVAALRYTDTSHLADQLLVEALLTLYNRSDRALAVLSLMPTMHQGEPPLVLAGPVAGRITPEGEGYAFAPDTATSSTLPVHGGLLLPRQALQVKLTYRPLGRIERFIARVLTAAQSYDGTPASLAPLCVYVPAPDAPEQRFVPFGDAAWRELCKPMPVVTPPGPGLPLRRALVVTTGDAAPTEVAGRVYPQPLPTDVMSIEEALKVATRLCGPGAQPGLGYSRALGGYVVVNGEAHWLLRRLDQPAPGEPLPEFPLLLLRDVDAGAVPVALAPGLGAVTEGKLWGAYAVAQPVPPATTPRLMLDAAALSGFLATVQTHNALVRCEQDVYGRRAYTLTPR